MHVKNEQDRDSELEECIKSVVAKLIGEEVQEVVRTTIVEQLALRFGAVPDARKARAAIRAFRPDWNRRAQWKEVRESVEDKNEEDDNLIKEASRRGKATQFSPPKLVR